MHPLQASVAGSVDVSVAGSADVSCRLLHLVLIVFDADPSMQILHSMTQGKTRHAFDPGPWLPKGLQLEMKAAFFFKSDSS